MHIFRGMARQQKSRARICLARQVFGNDFQRESLAAVRNQPTGTPLASLSPV
jgi:hypothetical protein